MMLKKAWAVIVLLYFIGIAVYAQTPGHTEFYRDTTGSATIDQILNVDFSPANLPLSVHPNPKEAYWIKLSAQHYSDFIAFSDWSIIELYWRNPNSIWFSKKTGHLVPYLERDVPFNNQLLIEMPEATEDTFYVKLIFSTNSLHFPDVINPISISAAQFVKNKTSFNYIDQIVLGFLLCILIFLVFLYFHSRDNALITFGIYLLLWIYTIIHNSGRLLSAFSFITDLPLHIPYLDILLTASLITIFAILVMYRLVDFTQWFKLEKKFFNLLIVILASFPFIGLFTLHKIYIVHGVYITICITVVAFLYIAIKALLKKIPFSLFFLMANLPFFMGTLIYLVAVAGFINIPTQYHNLFLSIGVLFQSVFFTILFSYRYNRINTKYYQNKLAVLQQNQRLSAMALNLSRKNTLLENIQQLTKDTASDSEIKPVLKMIEQDLSFDNSWEEFKMHFEKVNQGFFNSLLAKHPTLTANEQRLCAYLKLSLSSKEIAQLLHRSPSSIEKARYRLRKKMELSNDQNLSSYIQIF